MRYLVITPVRNEEANIPRTIASFVAQTVRPSCWMIVDDGSTDRTGKIADLAAAEHAWIQVCHRTDRGFRQPGTGVVQAFGDGLAAVANGTWDFLVKLDGDLEFGPDYFEKCFEEFEKNPKLGIGGGTICQRVGQELRVESGGDPAFHVRGATKIYRWDCWVQLGGLMPAPGWDTIDELKANMLGWETYTFPALKIHQLKDTGSADGRWRNWVKNGFANYVTGYHPLFMAAKCLRRMARPPYVLGGCALAFGYLKGLLSRAPRVQDSELIRFVRRQQMNCLRKQPSLWDRPLGKPVKA
jgi:poly-beta-1,6-N-acetyl-D-glucosamine synthase